MFSYICNVYLSVTIIREIMQAIRRTVIPESCCIYSLTYSSEQEH